MSSYTAAAQFMRRVREFAQTQPEWAEAVRYQSRPDERWHVPLVSYRVYGTWDESLAIVAAAGLDSVEQELREQLLVLPTPRQLEEIKRLCGYVNDRWSRDPEATADPIGTR